MLGVLRVFGEPLWLKFPAELSGSQVIPIVRRVDLRVQVVGQLVEECHVDLIDQVDGGFTFPLGLLHGVELVAVEFDGGWVSVPVVFAVDYYR